MAKAVIGEASLRRSASWRQLFQDLQQLGRELKLCAAGDPVFTLSVHVAALGEAVRMLPSNPKNAAVRLLDIEQQLRGTSSEGWRAFSIYMRSLAVAVTQTSIDLADSQQVIKEAEALARSAHGDNADEMQRYLTAMQQQAEEAITRATVDAPMQWREPIAKTIKKLRESRTAGNAMIAQPVQETFREFPSGLLSVDNSALYHEFRKAVAAADFTVPEGEHWPAADLNTKTMKARAELRPADNTVDTMDDESLSVWEQRMRAKVLSLDDLTADVLDVISAVWIQKAEHKEDLVYLTADDFLRLRGLKAKKNGDGRRGGFDDAQRRKIGDHIETLSQTWITVAEMNVTEEVEDSKGHKRRRRTKWEGEVPAVMVARRAGQRRLDGSLDVHAWRIRPGDAFTAFLMGAGRQTALLSQKALEYDPDKQKWEKRLTRYLTYLWRNRQSKGNYLEAPAVRAFLQALKMDVDVKNPIRTKERFEKALDTLQNDHVLSSWQYVAAPEEIVGQKDWAKKWLTWRVVIEPPQEIMDHYATIKALPERTTPGPVKADESKRNVSAVDIKRIRLERGLNLSQAAEQIGISVSRLSRIEHGDKPGADTVQKMQAWAEG